jgi:prevent-host-death family protein
LNAGIGTPVAKGPDPYDPGYGNHFAEAGMREVGAIEAKNRFALLDGVEKGEEVLITRRGKIVARLVKIKELADEGRT